MDRSTEYYESIMLEFPVTMVGLRILPRGASIPGEIEYVNIAKTKISNAIEGLPMKTSSLDDPGRL